MTRPIRWIQSAENRLLLGRIIFAFLCLTAVWSLGRHHLSQDEPKPYTLAPMPRAQAEPVDPNTASKAQLELLPGIGPSLAQAIIDCRETAGPFRTVADLDSVQGIGPAKLAKVAPFIQFASQPSANPSPANPGR